MKNLKILKVEDQFIFQCACTIFDMLRGSAPDMFNLTQGQISSNSHQTRSTTNRPENLRKTVSNTLKKTQSFPGAATDIWNSLPHAIQTAESKPLFKALLRKSILDDYCDKLDCSNPRCSDRRFHHQ